MKTIFIDDEPDIRFNIFIDYIKSCGLTTDNPIHFDKALSSSEAIQKLNSNDYDIISFDHDLGGNDTTMRVVDFIRQNEHNFRNKRFIVHSMNPIGRKNIILSLSKIEGAIVTDMPFNIMKQLV